MSFLQPWMLLALPLITLPIIIHLINQWRFQTKRWGAMMFLLAANRMNRGYTKLRQYLILAMRVLAIGGLIFAISRPLASGILGFSAGGSADTTIVLLDRSPSMQQQGAAGQTKLDTGLRQIAQTLKTLGSTNYVLIESNRTSPQVFDTLDALVDSPATEASSATADLPTMLQTAVDYMQNNKPGPTELWICSDMRTADWSAESGNWNAVRDALQSFPQSVRIHLLAYPQTTDRNFAIRVSDVRRQSDADGQSVVMSIQVSHSGESAEKRSIPVQVEIEGARSELDVEMTGSLAEIRNHKVALSGNQKRGWGKVSIPADENNADNQYYFVFDEPAIRRIVLVSENRDATRALEIAAAVSADAQSPSSVDVVAPDQLDSLTLDGAALTIWQTSLPQGDLAAAIQKYIGEGGQVIFFPPASVLTGVGASDSKFLGVGWGDWVARDEDAKVMVENWRGDQDLLAATRSGAGLPVGQLEIRGYAKLTGESSKLATLTGGDALLARVPTEKGGVYFCTASPASDSSTLAANGIVLYAVIQRAIEQGLTALGNTTQRIAGASDEPTDDWRSLHIAKGAEEQLISTEMPWQAGVYQTEDRLFAINRSLGEDQRDMVSDREVSRLFAGLDFSRVDDSAGSLAGIVREVWRLFLMSMIFALLIEALLCMPRKILATQVSLSSMQKAA
jgi:Aerotolerance regulator N-terminal